MRVIHLIYKIALFFIGLGLLLAALITFLPVGILGGGSIFMIPATAGTSIAWSAIAIPIMVILIMLMIAALIMMGVLPASSIAIIPNLGGKAASGIWGTLEKIVKFVGMGLLIILGMFFLLILSLLST